MPGIRNCSIVGDDDPAVFEQIGVVRLVQIAGPGASLPRMTVRPQRIASGIGNLDDRVIAFLVRDDRLAAVSEERVVRKIEAGRRRGRVRVGKSPVDRAFRIDQQQSVVTPVGDEQLAGEGFGAGALRTATR